MDNCLCPICQSTTTTPLLNLKQSNIYQHPVPKDAVIPKPYRLDIDFHFCRSCGHAFQNNYDTDLLNAIYANHYYTPAQDGIGRKFRDDFIAFIKSNIPEITSAHFLLEIGSSSGEILIASLESWPHLSLLGYEPSNNSADIAISKGIPTIKSFFTTKTVQTNTKFDIIFSRHVVEHIDNQDDFWTAIGLSSNERTLLVLETPSLDSVLYKSSLDPFHIEHLHIFSTYSISKVAARFGWFMRSCTITDSNNLICCFSKDNRQSIETVAPVLQNSLNDILIQTKQKLSNRLKGKNYWLWGAGSYGTKMLSFYDLKPQKILDGNKNKSGKVMVGYPWEIEYGPEAIAKFKRADAAIAPTIVIGSSFYKEIMTIIESLGWQGEILKPTDWES